MHGVQFSMDVGALGLRQTQSSEDIKIALEDLPTVGLGSLAQLLVEEASMTRLHDGS